MPSPTNASLRRRAAGRGPARLAPALAIGATLAWFGCTDLSSIDRRIDGLVESRTLGIDGGAPPARLHKPTPDHDDAPNQTDKNPRTINPPSGALSYTGSPPGRDVLARLDDYAAVPADALALDLESALHVTQTTAREYITAEEEYILAAIRLLIERHRWGPRLFDDISTSVSATPSGGEYDTALNVINELRATQRLPYGGEVEAKLITRAVEQLTHIVGDEYHQSSELALSANIPLLRNAGLIAQEDLIQAERDLVYGARTFENFRRTFFVDIARDYFTLLAEQSAIRNQERRLDGLTRFLDQIRALVEAGRERAFQAKNVEQSALESRNTLINQREAYILGLDRFKIRLGIPVERPVVLRPVSVELQDPDVGVAQAAELALRYRLDYQNEVDRVDDSRRGVANARNQVLPDLNAQLSASFNTDPSVKAAGVTFNLDQTSYTAGITFGLPLDREIERLQLRSAVISLQQRSRTLDQFRDNLILSARQAVREIDRARFSLTLQEKAVEINELRLAEILIKADEVDTRTRLDAENELLRSSNDRDGAVRDLRVAILEYLLRTGQLRVARDGTFVPLQGMLVRMIGEEGAGPGPAPAASAATGVQPPAPAPEKPAPQPEQPAPPAGRP